MCCDDEKCDFRWPRILSLVAISVSSAAILIGIVTPEWTELGGGYWSTRFELPVLLTVSRTLTLVSCLGIVLAEVLYLGSVLCEGLDRYLANVIEAIILFISSFTLLVALVLFSQYRLDEQLGEYGYSFYLTCAGAAGVLIADVFAAFDVRSGNTAELDPLL